MMVEKQLATWVWCITFYLRAFPGTPLWVQRQLKIVSEQIRGIFLRPHRINKKAPKATETNYKITQIFGISITMQNPSGS